MALEVRDARSRLASPTSASADVASDTPTDAQFAVAYTVVSCLASSSLAAALSLWYRATLRRRSTTGGCRCGAAESALPREPAAPNVDLATALAPAEYAAHGLGPLKETATSTALYLDMLKRVLVNVVYHEQSHTVSLARSIAEGRPDPVRADPAAFSLKDRALGEDVALNALSMVGLKRLDNIEDA